jgi:hypothetical protein
MASDVSRDEFGHLEARVTVVEQEVEGEKMVTRHILEQSRRNGADLADLKTDLADFKRDMADFKGDMADFKKQTGERFDRLERKVDTLRRDIPGIVGEVMRDVLRERDTER